ncbi:MAG: HNH endonuclease [Planctomycetia bacterium]|nr:HNH endonuclease [Planctomycetia bacterium]
MVYRFGCRKAIKMCRMSGKGASEDDVMARRSWTRDETLVAFNLYCRTPFGRLHARNPDIIKVAKALNRTAGAVAMKCCNLAAFDPALKARGVRGLSKASQEDRAICEQFAADPESIGFECETAAARLCGAEPELSEAVLWEDVQGLDRETIVKVRVNQCLFRSIVLAGYDYACSICTMPIRGLLVASHIVPWSVDREQRMNPRNGICLCVLHDRAFDMGLLIVNDAFEVQVHVDLKSLRSNKAVEHGLIEFDGLRIRLPDRWQPDPALLRRHSELVGWN